MLRDGAGTSYAIPGQALARFRVSTDHRLSLEDFLNGDGPIAQRGFSVGRRATPLTPRAARRTPADPHLTCIWHRRLAGRHEWW
jgi:hypothetical protein